MSIQGSTVAAESGIFHLSRTSFPINIGQYPPYRSGLTIRRDSDPLGPDDAAIHGPLKRSHQSIPKIQAAAPETRAAAPDIYSAIPKPVSQIPISITRIPKPASSIPASTNPILAPITLDSLSVSSIPAPTKPTFTPPSDGSIPELANLVDGQDRDDIGYGSVPQSIDSFYNQATPSVSSYFTQSSQYGDSGDSTYGGEAFGRLFTNGAISAKGVLFDIQKIGNVIFNHYGNCNDRHDRCGCIRAPVCDPSPRPCDPCVCRCRCCGHDRCRDARPWPCPPPPPPADLTAVSMVGNYQPNSSSSERSVAHLPPPKRRRVRAPVTEAQPLTQAALGHHTDTIHNVEASAQIGLGELSANEQNQTASLYEMPVPDEVPIQNQAVVQEETVVPELALNTVHVPPGEMPRTVFQEATAALTGPTPLGYEQNTTNGPEWAINSSRIPLNRVTVHVHNP